MTDHINREKLKDRIRADDACEVEAGIPPMTTTPDLIDEVNGLIASLESMPENERVGLQNWAKHRLLPLLERCLTALESRQAAGVDAISKRLDVIGETLDSNKDYQWRKAVIRRMVGGIREILANHHEAKPRTEGEVGAIMAEVERVATCRDEGHNWHFEKTGERCTCAKVSMTRLSEILAKHLDGTFEGWGRVHIPDDPEWLEFTKVDYPAVHVWLSPFGWEMSITEHGVRMRKPRIEAFTIEQALKKADAMLDALPQPEVNKCQHKDYNHLTSMCRDCGEFLESPPDTP